MVLRSHAAARLSTGCTCSLGRRNFSSSMPWRRRGALATFPKTSSRELDNIIARFRETAFIPSHLSEAYRKMIYKPSEHVYLTGEEPVKVSLPIRPVVPGQALPRPSTKPKPAKPAEADGKGRDSSRVPRAKAPHVHAQKKSRPPRDTFTLSPLQIVTDVPATRPEYLRMLRLMQKPSDFQIVPAFLQELRTARLPVTAKMLAKTARRSAELDSVDVLVQMFQSGHSQGLQINHPDILEQVMPAIVRHAANGYWSKQRLESAQNLADSVLIMLRDPRHQTATNSLANSSGVHSLPWVYGTAMALEAVSMLRYGTNSPAPHRTHSLSTLATSFLELLDLASIKGKGDMAWQQQNAFLACWAPSIVGTRYAVSALNEHDAVGMKLKLVLPALEEVLAKSLEAMETAPPVLEMGEERLGVKILRSIEGALTAEAPAEAPREEPVFVGSDEVVEGEEVLDGEVSGKRAP